MRGDILQRTEIYEYSKVIGNSQFVLLPFQPYKLVYAYMLVEVGKVSDSLRWVLWLLFLPYLLLLTQLYACIRYCQASMKILKNSSRTPEVELWKALFASLEERLRAHQQVFLARYFSPLLFYFSPSLTDVKVWTYAKYVFSSF